MNIVIFGATGGTGRSLVQQALEKGYNVRAFVRDPAKFNTRHPQLEVIQGDVLDVEKVKAAVEGMDVILSALGTHIRKADHTISEGVKNIVAAMKEKSIRRLIFLSSLGVAESREQAGKFFNKVFLPLFLKEIFEDKEIQESIIRESDLDWTLVRPGRLTNGSRTGNYRSGLNPNISGKVSRADVADFMLREVNDQIYVKKAPAIAY